MKGEGTARWRPVTLPVLSTRIRATPDRLALGAIVLLATALNVVQLGSEGYANSYYAAAVKSMLLNWHNFFFVSFDPGGFVAVDKPPLGLWIQVASAKIFGFNGVAMLLPQAIAGVLSVIVLYALVARSFGRPAGLLAALGLALTPIAVVDNRNNSADSLLILTMLLAGWAVVRAVESGRLRWLLTSATLIGLGFNIKELEAYLVLPAVLGVYLLGARHGRLTRIRHLLIAGMTTLIVSFAWIVAVDSTPASQRPYVSDSGNNSELSLALGYNGLGRLATGIMSHLPTIPFIHIKVDLTIVPGASLEIGNPGLLRLFDPVIGGQASWLLPLALIGLPLALFQIRPRFPLRAEHVVLLFWGLWLLAGVVFFSVARFYHLYYLSMLAPAVAALAGIGLIALWKDYRLGLSAGTWWNGWLLPAALLLTALVQAHLLSGYAGWNGWLGPVIVIATLGLAVTLIAGRVRLRLLLAPEIVLRVDLRVALAALGLAVATLLAAPTAFAADSIANGNGGAWLPQAGPSVGFGAGGFGGGNFAFGRRARSGGFGFPGGGTGSPPANGAGGFPGGESPPGNSSRGFGGAFRGGGGALTFAGSQIPKLDPRLLSYLTTHRGGARYLVATPTSSYASLFILNTGQPVLTIGGYQGWDKILTIAELRQLIATGAIRYFLLTGGDTGAGGLGQAGGTFGRGRLPGGVDASVTGINNALLNWVRSTCASVPAAKYTSGSVTVIGQVPGGGFGAGGFRASGPGQLYSCSAALAR